MIFLLMLLLIVILTLGRGGEVKPYEVPPGEDVFEVVEGTWDWRTRDDVCRGNPHTISFTTDRDTMILRFRHPYDSTTGKQEARYEIRDVTASHIRGFMEGETRKTATGALAVWDLVLTSPDSYRWHRTDWSPSGYTPEIVRCDGETPRRRERAGEP